MTASTTQNGRIQVEGVRHVYKKGGTLALDGVDLEIGTLNDQGRILYAYSGVQRKGLSQLLKSFIGRKQLG